MFTMEFKTGNAAFHDDEFDNFATTDEVARILRDVAAKIECGYVQGGCIDYNGNRVGSWQLDS